MLRIYNYYKKKSTCYLSFHSFIHEMARNKTFLLIFVQIENQIHDFSIKMLIFNVIKKGISIR